MQLELHTNMHLKRWVKRLALVALILLVAQFVFRIRFTFTPEETVDAQLRRFIRGSFAMPNSADRAAGALGTVKRVHFMHRTDTILPDYRPYVSSWRHVYPSYDLYFWTDADIELLVSSRYPQLLTFYHKQLTNALERSDFARILVLHSFGGWYADLDAGCQLSSENLTERHSLIVPLEPHIHSLVSFNRRRLVNNAVMYSTPGHPYWLFYAHRIASDMVGMPIKRTKDDAVFSTGPVVMTKAMEQFLKAHDDRCANDGKGDPADFWCPYLPNPRLFNPLIDKSSHWLTSWARVMCYTVFLEPEIIQECERLRQNSFANRLPEDAYTYHAFLHLTGAKKTAARDSVTKWGLDLRLQPMKYLAA